MACSNVCKICPRLIISEAVTFNAGTLIINIPAGSYNDNGKYCIVVAQAIPTETTITAPVVITIGDGTVQYPVTGCDCSQLIACQIRTRTRYAARVATTATGGTFKLLGRARCALGNNLAAIDGTDPAAAGA